MADWDEDSSQLVENLQRVLRAIRDAARERIRPTIEQARTWQAQTMRGLRVPDPEFVGQFRGEPGLEDVQVRIAGRYGVASHEVPAALLAFEQKLQAIIARLDELIPPERDPNSDQRAAVLEVCAWVHAQWVRIHPFANGNGRTARLWVNSIAMRYGLPPFVRLRPRPDNGYGAGIARTDRHSVD